MTWSWVKCFHTRIYKYPLCLFKFCIERNNMQLILNFITIIHLIDDITCFFIYGDNTTAWLEAFSVWYLRFDAECHQTALSVLNIYFFDCTSGKELFLTWMLWFLSFLFWREPKKSWPLCHIIFIPQKNRRTCITKVNKGTKVKWLKTYKILKEKLINSTRV